MAAEATAVHPFASVFVTVYEFEEVTVIASVVSVVDQTFPPVTDEVNTVDTQKLPVEGEIDTKLAG